MPASRASGEGRPRLWRRTAPLLVTIAAIWPSVAEGKGPHLGERRAMLRRWFCCSTFSGSYDNAAVSTAEADHVALKAWLEGGDPPNVVAGFTFDVERLCDVTARQRALYQSTIALLMRRSPRDLYDGAPLTGPIISGRAVDDHHVFPHAWLKANGLDDRPDTVLNHALIGKITNFLIGGRAPSNYLGEMRDALRDELGPILDSHGLPSDADGPLFNDRYDEFLEWRPDHLARELRAVTA